MAPNGNTASRKTPAASKPAKSNEDGDTLEEMFEDLEREAAVEVKDDVRKALPSFEKPGSWDSEVAASAKSKDSQSKPRPQMNKVPASLAKAFPNSRPMSDKPEILKCKECGRAVSKHVMPKHVENCLKKRKEKQRKKKEAKDARDAAARKERNGTAANSDDEDMEDVKKTTSNKTGGLGASKKRKAGEGEEDGGPAKKKKKKEDKSKAQKPKLPVDVEKQCGVELPNGGLCARSLTCKSHSMGAKRAVRRSTTYDRLLAEYQRKNQAKLQKAQLEANAAGVEDENLPSGPVDSDEEKEIVMAAIQRSWGGAPIYNPTPVPLRGKYQHNRIKGMLQSALGGRNGASLFGTSAAGNSSATGFFGSAPAPIMDEQGIVHARRGSVVPGARSMIPGGSSRRPSAVAT